MEKLVGKVSQPKWQWASHEQWPLEQMIPKEEAVLVKTETAENLVLEDLRPSRSITSEKLPVDVGSE